MPRLFDTILGGNGTKYMSETQHLLVADLHPDHMETRLTSPKMSLLITIILNIILTQTPDIT